MDERERIVVELARRAATIPKGFYDLDRPVNRFLYERYTATARTLLCQCGLPDLEQVQILEVGCGKAQWLAQFQAWGASAQRLHGIDLDAKRIGHARERLPEADLRAGDASSLPWADGTFDLIVQATVFTSILTSEMREAVAREMVRVLRPGGVILWYDFVYHNPRNLHVRGIGLRQIAKLFPGLTMNYRRVTLAPPLARAIVPLSLGLADALDRCPFLRTHVLATLQKPPAAGGRIR